VPLNLFWLDADDVHATRQNPLEVHEHLRPVETAGIDYAIEESSAIVQLGVLIEVKKPIQLATLRFQAGRLPAHLFGSGAEGGVGFADGIDVPAKPGKRDACDDSNEP
jgi:hypothetical protein